MSEATLLARMSVIRSTEAHRGSRGERFAAEISTRESQGRRRVHTRLSGTSEPSRVQHHGLAVCFGRVGWLRLTVALA
jgi:hypothetical protein